MSSVASDMGDEEVTVADLRDEVVALRRESAARDARHARQIETLTETLTETLARPKGKPRAGTNLQVRSKKFFVPIGPDAEDHPEFEERWESLMRSETAHQGMRNAFGKLIVRVINEEGRDMQSNNPGLLLVAFAVASDVLKLKPLDDLACNVAAHDEETDDSDDDEEPELTGDDPEAARTAARTAAKRALERKREKLIKESQETWTKMSEDEQNSYRAAWGRPDGPIEIKVRDLMQKARTGFISPMLKEKLRKHASSLVPYTDDVAADAVTYKESKMAFHGTPGPTKWPRQCGLLCGTDAHGDPQFYYTDEADGEDILHPFSAFVLDVAAECEIEEDQITPNLVAWLADMAGQICNVSKRKRGRGICKLVQGDLDDHTKWNAGIQRALKWMKSREKCPTISPLIKKIQKKAKKAK